jgi:probable phosphoglycerate mutase
MIAVQTGSEHLTRAMRALEALFLIGVEGVTEIWLVRHGDSYKDMTEVEDPPLSAIGRDQAQRLAERVRRMQPAAVYSSPYRRALQTAKAITDDVHLDARLVEVALDVGEDGSLDLKEDPLAAASRMRESLEDVVRDHAGGRVVVVSHGAAIVACLSDVMRLEPGQLRVLPYYTSISTVRVLGERRMVGGIGDTAHLE